MLRFAPAILLADSVIELPRPITVCRLHDSWDFLKMKVPRLDGDQLAGPSRNGVELTIEGQIGSQSGELKLSEELMLDTAELLRAAAHTMEDVGFSFALYQGEPGRYRYFRRCLTNRCDIDFSNPQIYSYSLSVHAADPVLYDGLPA